MQRYLQGQRALHGAVHDEHWTDVDCIFFVVDVHFRRFVIFFGAFCILLVAHGYIYLSLDRFVFIISVLDLEVKFDELFGVFRTTCNRLRCSLLACTISDILACIIACICLEYACRLLSQSSQTFKS